MLIANVKDSYSSQLHRCSIFVGLAPGVQRREAKAPPTCACATAKRSTAIPPPACIP
jgi:hypothetical protein